jgi:hypothetical protein
MLNYTFTPTSVRAISRAQFAPQRMTAAGTGTKCCIKVLNSCRVHTQTNDAPTDVEGTSGPSTENFIVEIVYDSLYRV